MSAFSIRDYYAGQAQQIQSQIDTVERQLKSGKKDLSIQQQQEVVALSDKATVLNDVSASIVKAQAALTSAQRGLESLVKILKEMGELAAQANSPSLSSADGMRLNVNLQTKIGEFGKVVVAVGKEGFNLLSGYDSMAVKLGSNKHMNINTLDLYGMVACGALNNINISTYDGAKSAVDSLSQAMSTLLNGQSTFKLVASDLNKKLSTISGDVSQTTNSLNTLQNVDVVRMTNRLNSLYAQKEAYSL